MEKLITAITGSSLTLHWQLHTSCCSASINLKWPATVPAQFNTKKLKLVKKKVLKILCKVVHDFNTVLSTPWKTHCSSISTDFSFFFVCVYVFLYLYMCVCVCAYMHKHPRNVDVSELNFSYHLFIFGL